MYYSRRTGILTLLCFNLLSCSQPSPEIKAYNDQLVAITSITHKKGNLLGRAIGEALIDRDYNQLRPLLGEATNLILQNLDSVKQLQPVRGGEPFREAVLDLLQFERLILIDVMKPLNEPPAKLSDDIIQSIMKRLFELDQAEQKKFEMVKERQKLFANQFGLQVDDSEV
ncbi:MAG TPA: hypothetical protein VHK91_13025 [Flavisolibacter sp.]|nr:hypothetical protein [Flavisolibacter sp.]